MNITVRRSIELIGVIAAFALLIYGKSIFMPLLLAFFVSILLMPVCNFFMRIRLWEIPSIVLSIILAIFVVAAILGLLSYQVSILVSDFPEIEKNVNMHWQNISNWINAKTNFSTREQLELIREQWNKQADNLSNLLSGAALSLSSILIFLGLMPIYIFLIMFYRNLLLQFVFCWFKEGDHTQVKSALNEIKVIIKNYLAGLLIQITYITILTSGILLLFGIKHAILIGVMFGLLNLIPYIGALITNILSVVLTLTSSQNMVDPLIVLGVIAFVQFLDNNILMPYIVGSKIKINALVSIIGVFIGGTIAGVTGMFLSMPVIAILKIIFDRTTSFRQWGLLFGDERPDVSPMVERSLRFLGWNRKPKKEENKQ